LANPRDGGSTDLPRLLRRLADAIEERGIQPMEILDLTIESEGEDVPPAVERARRIRREPGFPESLTSPDLPSIASRLLQRTGDGAERSTPTRLAS
jgi:hypothetical protein